MSHTITRKMTLDAGHRVPDHKSRCKSLHGHTYCIEATFTCNQLVSEGAANGMVADFGDVKEILTKEIHDRCDHKMILYYKDPMLKTIALPESSFDTVSFSSDSLFGFDEVGMHGTQLHIVNFIPTAENLAEYWANCVATELFKRGVDYILRKVRVWETPNCYAEYETLLWSAPAGTHRGTVDMFQEVPTSADPPPVEPSSSQAPEDTGQVRVVCGTYDTQANAPFLRDRS